MKYSIVIPTYNHCSDLLIPCVESLKRYTDFFTAELVIVANGCTDGTLDYFNSLDIPHKKLVWRDEAIGYTKAANLGIKASSGDYIVLLNNDTEILTSGTNYWLERLWLPFRDDPQMMLTGTLKLTDGDIRRDFIVFCCAMLRRTVFDKLGLLDEVFNPGYGEDIDYAMRIEAAGLKWQCVDETVFRDGTNVGTFPIWHKNNKTFGEIKEYGDIVARNKTILIERYLKPNNVKYSIVIPTYNHCSDLLKPCLESIMQYTDMSTAEVVVVANGCVDGTREYVESLGEPFKLVWVDEAIGYTKATNLGIKASRGQYIVLLNNDTMLLPQSKNQWLQLLEYPFIADQRCGITGPMKFSWDCGGVNREAMAFWLVMVPRKLFMELGNLDEIFSPGMGEDGDFSIRVAEAGYRLVSVPHDYTFEFTKGPTSTSFPIWHKGNGTFGDDEVAKNQAILRNNKILNYRWGMESKKQIDVTIIIPTAHNFEKALKPGLEAVLAYTDLSNKEIIVVANGSPPEAKEFLNGHSDRISYIWSDEPTGVVRAYNAGIERSRGKWIVLIDDDSHLMPQPVDHWINILLKPFLEEDMVGASGPFAHEYADMGFILHSGCTMYDGNLLRRLKFDEAFNPGYFSDPDVSMRIWREGYRCVEVPEHNPDKKYVNNTFVVQFPVVHLGTVQTMNKHKDIELVQRNRDLLYRRYGRNTITQSLQDKFDYYCEQIIDINEHMPTLRRYAKECNHITEFGTRFVVSTYGFMAGKPSKLITYDLYPHPNIWTADHIARENNIQFAFMERDTTKIEIEPTDLLFIDTLHDYNQIKTELALHADKVRKYIICHDTESYGYHNEDGSPGGLMPAINEFLAENSQWKVKEHYTNCNGLMVLERTTGSTTITSSLQEMYDHWCKNSLDINEHLPTLRKYSTGCSHITELGTRYVVSTYAFMAGKPTKLVSYDIVPHKNIWKAAEIAKENGIEFAFMERDTTKVEIEETDLLFIDTLHDYRQIKAELTLHARKARKYIICHDTVSYGWHNEDGTSGGLMPAINEFLAENKQWQIKEHHKNCNGLMIMERVAPDGVSGKPEQLPVQVIREQPIIVNEPVVAGAKYSIVIPTYNHCDDLLKPCIESIVKYTDMSNVEVVVVANGCVDGTREYVDSLPSWAKLVWVDDAIGYTKATNLGIGASTGKYIVLLNNDTELLPQPTNQWLNMLEEPLKAEDGGLSGPLQLYDRYAGSWVLIFFCVMVKRDLFDAIGLLDEIFTPGGGEDIDFTVRANLAGYKAVCVTETRFSPEVGTNVGQFPIWHKDNRTFRDIDEYGKFIIKRNGLINCKRYNKDIRLNLGSGGIEYEGYLSVDKYDGRANILMDITKLDFEDGTVTELLASHVFEHLNPYHALDILKDWHRVLKPGGKLIMEMPDLERLCKAFVGASTGERYGLVNAIYGSVNTTGVGGDDKITSPHLFGWWPQSLWDHLTNAGFIGIQFGDEQLPHPPYGMNLRVEAVKPL